MTQMGQLPPYSFGRVVGTSAPIVLAASSTPWHPDSAGLGRRGYLPPRSNGLIGGRSFMIAHNLKSVSGSRLLWPAMVIK